MKRKDEEALRMLMQLYGDDLLRTAYLLLRDRHEAEEAVQDSFIMAYERIVQLKDDTKLKSWLIRIVVNRCRMKQRTWSFRNLFPSAQMEKWLAEDQEPGPEEQLMQELKNGRLTTAIHHLSYIYREVITLHYFQEFSVNEIAEHLDLNSNTVKARLARGRNALRQALEKEGDVEWNKNSHI
ncbi:RNA polymerase sigma factor [Paenibacillus dendrobii]|uniref:RNA polymerase sigma factor n=1 Tax=Paenibacillus dendrobii TaxID=2691084 RepID=UPI001F002A57|nr:sigma-70 family RNA polymerase sigma factor [Paenibacillus dendrobii]